MIGLAFRSIWGRRLAAGLAFAGLVTSTSGFLLLTGLGKTSEAVLAGDIGRAWSAPFQILVRPASSTTELERDYGLVRPNFLSTAGGGITLAQLAAVREVPGVVVAAPLAVLGFTQWPTALPLQLNEYADQSVALQLLRFRVGAEADDGSRYPPDAWWGVLYAPEGVVERQPLPDGSVRETLRLGREEVDCAKVAAAAPRLGVDGLVCAGGWDDPATYPLAWPQPIVIAAVDPQSEATLMKVDACTDTGRYLSRVDGVDSRDERGPVIPVLASQHSFLDEQLTVEVQRVDFDQGWLSEGGPESWHELADVSRSPDDAYQAFLTALAAGQTIYNASSLWSAGDVTYSVLGPDHLAATEVPSDLAIFQSAVEFGSPMIPVEATDTWLRPVTAHPQQTRSELFNRWRLIGTYDPACLPGFASLAGNALDTYRQPQVMLPNGDPIGPTRNMAGYLNTPPLLLTTLDAGRFLSDPDRFENGAGDAFISAIRVVVEGVEEPSQASQDKLARVATDIADATGLQVDIVAGSSTRPMQVELPAGSFGRPMTTVTEAWAVKGVAVTFRNALAGQNLAVFTVVLISALLLIAETAYVSVRRRIVEFGVLRSLGWTSRRIAAFVEIELLVLAVLAGLAGIALAPVLALAFQVQITSWHLLGVIPLSAAVALVAGIVPAVTAGRATPVVLLRGSAGLNPVRPRSVERLAIGDLAGARRAEAALGTLGVLLAASLVGSITLVSRSFAGVLDGTVLGTYLAVRVEPFHWLLAIMVLAVSALGLAQVVLLNYLQQQPQLAILRALGWARTMIGRYLVAQGLTIGVTGAVLAVGVVEGFGLVVSADRASMVLAGGVTVLVGVGLSLASVTLPILYAYAGSPSSRLRGP